MRSFQKKDFFGLFIIFWTLLYGQNTKMSITFLFHKQTFFIYFMKMSLDLCFTCNFNVKNAFQLKTTGADVGAQKWGLGPHGAIKLDFCILNCIFFSFEFFQKYFYFAVFQTYFMIFQSLFYDQNTKT